MTFFGSRWNRGLTECSAKTCGKGTTTGRRLFEQDGTSKRELDESTQEAERIEKLSLATAFNMDEPKEETEHR